MELQSFKKQEPRFIEIVRKSKIIKDKDKKEIYRTVYWRYTNNERFRGSLKNYCLVFIRNEYIGLCDNNYRDKLRERYSDVFSIKIE